MSLFLWPSCIIFVNNLCGFTTILKNFWNQSDFMCKKKYLVNRRGPRAWTETPGSAGPPSSGFFFWQFMNTTLVLHIFLPKESSITPGRLKNNEIQVTKSKNRHGFPLKSNIRDILGQHITITTWVTKPWQLFFTDSQQMISPYDDNYSHFNTKKIDCVCLCILNMDWYWCCIQRFVNCWLWSCLYHIS